MPKLGSVIPPSSPRARVEATNKIDLDPGWYDGVIKDVWIYSVDADGKFTKERTGEQKVSIKVALLGEDGKECGIVLDWRRRAYLSKRSHFALALEALTGLEAGSDAQRDFDSDGLVGMPVEVQTKRNNEYVNIEAFKPRGRPRRPAAPGQAAPAAASASRRPAYDGDDDYWAGYERR